MPKRIVANAARKAIAGFDLQISNVHGIPVRYWIAGIESLRGFTFPTGGPGVAIIMSSSRGKANLRHDHVPRGHHRPRAPARPDPRGLRRGLRAGRPDRAAGS